MISTLPPTLLLPLLAALGGAMAFGPSVVPGARQHAVALLATTILLALLAALLRGTAGGMSAALGVLLAVIIAAPLLDRARLVGLCVVAVAGGLALPPLLSELGAGLKPLSHAGEWLALLVAAALVGLVGSALLPRHPARVGNVLPAIAQPWIVAGHGVLALLLGLQSAQPDAVLVSGFAAALMVLLWARHHRHPHGLWLAGEALLAGTLAALLAPADTTLALLLGAAAAACVWQGPAIARGLRLDDAAHVLGSVLLPALLGLLLAGALDLAQLALQLRWLAAALMAAGLALPLWPAAMLLFGLGASPARVRAGLDFTL